MISRIILYHVYWRNIRFLLYSCIFPPKVCIVPVDFLEVTLHTVLPVTTTTNGHKNPVMSHYDKVFLKSMVTKFNLAYQSHLSLGFHTFCSNSENLTFKKKSFKGFVRLIVLLLIAKNSTDYIRGNFVKKIFRVICCYNKVYWLLRL